MLVKRKMIKKYNFENLISIEDNNKCIKKIDNLFDTDNWCKTVPHYQTWPNLFDYNQFYKFKYSFILSCHSYLGREVDIIEIKSWCYMNYHLNYSIKNIDTLWHSHGDKTDKKISGIFYLSNPKDVSDYASSGTEFKEFPNIIPEDFCWFIYPSYLIHRPGKIQSNLKRYVLACDFEYR
jgi:hypothetical protein